jgi:hypothetical protein
MHLAPRAPCAGQRVVLTTMPKIPDTNAMGIARSVTKSAMAVNIEIKPT